MKREKQRVEGKANATKKSKYPFATYAWSNVSVCVCNTIARASDWLQVLGQIVNTDLNKYFVGFANITVANVFC